jgi:hypothetical protein
MAGESMCRLSTFGGRKLARAAIARVGFPNHHSRVKRQLDVMLQRPSMRRASERAVVRTFTTSATKRSGTLRGSYGENCIPNFGRSFAIDAELPEFELTFPDPIPEFNTGEGDRGASKALQSKHRAQMKFDRSSPRTSLAARCDAW